MRETASPFLTISPPSRPRLPNSRPSLPWRTNPHRPSTSRLCQSRPTIYPPFSRRRRCGIDDHREDLRAVALLSESPPRRPRSPASPVFVSVDGVARVLATAHRCWSRRRWLEAREHLLVLVRRLVEPEAPRSLNDQTRNSTCRTLPGIPGPLMLPCLGSQKRETAQQWKSWEWLISRLWSRLGHYRSRRTATRKYRPLLLQTHHDMDRFVG